MRSAVRRVLFWLAIALPMSAAAAADRVTVLYVNGVATSPAQAAADRDALARAIADASLRPGYPQRIEVRNAHNPSNGIDADVAELVALKVNEEAYLARLHAGFLAGRDAPEVLAPQDLAEVYQTFLPRDPLTIRTLVEQLVAAWAPLLADPRRQLVLVGHSQGNFVVNWTLLGLLRAMGPAALDQVRVVNLASSTVWSPFGLDVTLAEDQGVFSFLAGKGLGQPRDTPYCRSAGQPRGCPFGTAAASVSSGGVCTTSAAAAATPNCHNLRATYLSDLQTEAIETERLAVGTFEREGPSLKQRVVEMVFSAIDSLNRSVPPGWQDDLFGAYFGFGATSGAPGEIRLQGSADAARAAAVGKATFDQGVSARWSGCMAAEPQGDGWIVLDMRRRDGVLPPSTALQQEPLWAVGFLVRASEPGTLYTVFGQSDQPRPGDGAELRAAQPPTSAGAFCGVFTLAIGADGFGRTEFAAPGGAAPLRWRSTRPVSTGVKRLHLSAFGASPIAVSELTLIAQPWATPFGSVR